MTRFSSRLPRELAPNAVSRAAAALRANGGVWADLTESNPTAVGLHYPAGTLEALADPSGLRYTPSPAGLRAAREIVAADYARRGVAIAADRILLTASTSEAYSFLFKLLCDPGAGVLVPQPSYPLFDLLTQLEGVRARPYRLEFDGAWRIDRDSLVSALSSDARAVLVVSPNNPTGSLLRRDDREWLDDLCARRSLALIGDEVFADFALRPRVDGSPVLGATRSLAFSLGGLSKTAGLPQVKLAWIAVDGPAAAAAAALERLELIADTYLSVSTPVQLAAGPLLDAGASVRAAILDRTRTNLAALRAGVAQHPSVSLLEPEAGWSAVLRVPAIVSEEALVLRLLHEARVLVHPGYFFDFDHEAFIVVSLLPEPDVFTGAIERVLTIAAGGTS